MSAAWAPPSADAFRAGALTLEATTRPTISASTTSAIGAAERAVVRAGGHAANRSTAAPNTSVWRSTSPASWCGDSSAMLWKGVSRMPRLSAHRCMNASSCVVDGGRGLRAVAGRRAEPVLGPAAQLLHGPGEVVGVDGGLHAVGPPAGQRDGPAELVVGERASTAWPCTAASASALPVRVPPTPLTSTSSAKSGPRRRSATSAERP